MRDIYAEALNRWGEQAQIMMLFEEMSELQQAICKDYRANDYSTRNNIAEEIADVEIMLEQMKELFDCHTHVSIQKNIKLKRLGETLDELKEQDGKAETYSKF